MSKIPDIMKRLITVRKGSCHRTNYFILVFFNFAISNLYYIMNPMSRNIEIKAKARDFQGQRSIAKSLGNGEAQNLFQEDTFFHVPSGRLKLREFGDGRGELIQYERSDSLEPAESQYLLYPTDNPAALKEALAKALGIRAIVRKKRTLYLVGQTRIHFDEVEGLGEFIELEVVLEPGENADYGTAIAQDLMKKLGIDKRDLIESAYVDMLGE